MMKTTYSKQAKAFLGMSQKKGMFGPFLKILFSAFFVLAISVGTTQAKTLMLGHTVPPSHVWHKVAMAFAENLAAASNQQMTVKVSPLQKLGNEQQMFSMVESGAIQFSILPVGFLSNREESLMGWFMPYLFQNVQQAGKAVALPAAQQMLKNLEVHGVVGLGYMFAGMQNILSVKSVTSPADLINKKIRSFPSPIFNDWLRSMGAAATALPLAEIAPSLTTHLLDGAAVDLDIIVGMKYYQQANYLALTNHMSFPAILIVSKTWWKSLSEKDRVMIQEAYNKAGQLGLDWQIKAEIDNLNKLKQAGVIVPKIDMAAFKEKAKPVKDAYTSKNKLIGQFYQQAIDAQR
jgi:TRAP-type C4-dicarboxylate transport system substrate-binding protein